MVENTRKLTIRLIVSCLSYKQIQQNFPRLLASLPGPGPDTKQVLNNVFQFDVQYTGQEMGLFVCFLIFATFSPSATRFQNKNNHNIRLKHVLLACKRQTFLLRSSPLRNFCHSQANVLHKYTFFSDKVSSTRHLEDRTLHTCSLLRK